MVRVDNAVGLPIRKRKGEAVSKSVPVRKSHLHSPLTKGEGMVCL